MSHKNFEYIHSGAKRFLHLAGFLYLCKSTHKKNGTSYWECRRKGVCSARINLDKDGNLNKVPDGHNHQPDHDEVKAIKIVANVKKDAVNQRGAPPVQILNKIQNVPASVMAQLPSTLSLKQIVQRERVKNLPRNPQDLEDLIEIPAQYRVTLNDEDFLLYDSKEDRTWQCGNERIIMYGTEENLQLLSRSRTWFIDGTFKVVPTLFYQLVAILGSVVQKINGKEYKFAVPLVYALLTSKKEILYKQLLSSLLEQYSDLEFRLPTRVIIDFELALINAVKEKFGNIVLACFFHLCQNVFKKVVEVGLKIQYSDENDTGVRDATRKLCALAFVPVADVVRVFNLLKSSIERSTPRQFYDVIQYFEENYVRGKRLRGRNNFAEPRYKPELWNHYLSVLSDESRTNNNSEGWHTRFATVVGNDHPAFYRFLQSVQEEQGSTETLLRQIDLGIPVKRQQAPARKLREDRIKNIVERYDEFRDNGNEMQYLEYLSYYVSI